MKTRFSDNAAYVRYESLLKELHKCIADGRNDTPAVDAIHDQMDDLEPRLCQEEIERLNGLSADLYMLQGQEILEATDMTSEQVGQELNDAYNRDDWEQVLHLLRTQNRPSSVSVAMIAYLRARAYDELGHLDTALGFMEYAAVLRPDKENYQYFVISYLSRLNQSDNALRRAEQYIQAGNKSIDVRIQYGALLYMTTVEQQIEEGTPVFRQAIEMLLPALQEAKQDPSIPKPVLLLGFLALGSCYEELGQSTEALTAYSHALQIDPNNVDALTLRGILLAKSDWERAISDFERVVENNISNITPYLYVAYASLLRGDFERCIEVCRRIQGMTNEPDALAVIWQWIAISQYHQDTPIRTVVQNAQRASDLAPLNPRLQETLNLFLSIQESVEGLRSAQPQPLDIFTLATARPNPRNFLHLTMAA